MQLLNTIPIVFNGGSYGTYLHWALDTLTTDADIVAPFNLTSGNSHQFKGPHLLDMHGWNKYINSNNRHKFVRLHPKTKKEESISQNLDTLLETVDKVIYLYPDHSSKLLVINNFFTKIWSDWWSEQFDHDISVDHIYNNWPVDKNTNINDVPTWIKREFLSFYLMPAWHDQVEWYHLDQWKHDRCLILTVSDLLCDFTSSLDKIQKFCNLNFTKDILQMVPFHYQMLSLQRHLTSDLICSQIIDHTIHDKNFDWEPLTLIGESWIQWQLRNLGFEIRCDGLDTFPTNSIQLKNLLYNT